MLEGSAAQAAIASRRGLALAGGALAFTACEVLCRGDGIIEATLASLAELNAWARRTGGALEPRIGSLLNALSAPRPPFAGLALDRPRLMGIVNVTPDSFSDGGDFASPAAAIAHGTALAAAGADILDIGGESTRPGAEPVAPEEERARVVPVLDGLRGASVPRSIDTRHATVMRAAFAAGASIVNDVSGLTGDPASLPFAVESGAPIILMHMPGEPLTMNKAPHYDFVALDVYDALAERVAACLAAGIPRGRIAIDPGIGFGKWTSHNLAILERLGLFHGLGCALMLGASRKRFLSLGKAEGALPPRGRLAGSLAAALEGLGQGAQLLRVHDLAETAQAVEFWRALRVAEESAAEAKADTGVPVL
jgi:dihydropteroate synthase